MRRETVLVPGARRVEATLDAPDGDADACVVACPPHPQYRGSRHDARLGAVADALVDAGVACLRFDYGPWDRGRGERADARNACRWADERYGTIGAFGYSFGGAIAALAAADVDVEISAIALLAPVSTVDAGLDVVAAVAAVEAPLRVVYGERDTTADWEGVVAAARERGAAVEALPADHFFVGQHAKIVAAVVPFLVSALRA